MSVVKKKSTNYSNAYGIREKDKMEEDMSFSENIIFKELNVYCKSEKQNVWKEEFSGWTW